MIQTQTYLPNIPWSEYGKYVVVGTGIFLTAYPIKKGVENALEKKVDDVASRSRLAHVASTVYGGGIAYLLKAIYSKSLQVPEVVILAGGFLGLIGSSSCLWKRCLSRARKQ
ncbi:MAG: hypothetical protein K940chlam5_00023 [Candidatus Anoxychlamydiales bacterium]|nr:hypothetical protein [Candidatus Anoxychlamydiales bacterium]